MRTNRLGGGARLWLLAALALAAALPVRAGVDLGLLAEPVSLKRDRASDMVWGRNTKGPYTLSRRVIVPGSETVFINGARAFRPADYQIDYAAGTVTFGFPLPSGQVSRVDYSVDPKSSKPNVKAITAPLTLDLAELQLGSLMRSTLQFNGTWKHPDTGSPVMTALGMGVDSQLGKSTHITSMFAFTPRAARAGQTKDDLDASTMQVSAQTNVNGLQAKANFVRTGRAFAAAKEYKRKAGLQAFDLSTAYAFNKYLTARSSLQRTDELAASGGSSKATTVSAHEVVASISPSMKITAARNARQTEATGKPNEATTTDRVQVDQKLGQTTAAQVRHEVTTSEKDGKTQATTATTGLKLDQKLGQSGTAQVRHQIATSEKDGQAQGTTATTGVQVDQKLTGATSAQVRHEVVTKEKDGETQATTATTGLRLDQKLGQSGTAQVRHEIVTKENDGKSEETATTGVKLDAKLAKNTQVSAERVEAHRENQDPAVNTQVALATGNPGGLRLEGKYTQNQTPGKALLETRMARVEASPLGGLKLGGGVTQQQTGDKEQIQKHASVELKSYLGLQMLGRLNTQVGAGGRAEAMTRHAEARLKPLGAFEVSGRYTEREQLGQEGPATLGLNVTLSPFRFIQLSGGLTENPEENGKITPEERRTLGLKSSLGALSLTGAYAQRLNATDRPIAEELEVGVALQLTKYDRLFSSYKVAERLDTKLLGTEHYRVGYTRWMGSTFGLSLEGEYLREMENNRYLQGRDEARAKAGLNARF